MSTRKGHVLFDENDAVPIPEIGTTPSTETGISKLFVDSTDKVAQWKDSSGNVHSATRSNYAGFYIYNNAIEFPINAVNQWHLGLGTTASYLKGWTIDSGATGSITSFADYSGTVTDAIRANTAAAHGLTTGDVVSVTGTAAPNDYSGVYEITVIDTTSFYFINAGWNATTTGYWTKGDTFVAGAGSDGVYLMQGSNSIIPAAANIQLEMAGFKNASLLQNVIAKSKMAATTDSQVSSGVGMVEIVEGDKISYGGRDLTSSANFTVVHASIVVHQLY